jgi:hypothetical protein
MATHVERPPHPIIAPVGRPSAVGQRRQDEQLQERWFLGGRRIPWWTAGKRFRTAEQERWAGQERLEERQLA